MAYVVTREQIEARAIAKTHAEFDPNVEGDALHDECNDLIGEIHHEVFLVDPDRQTVMATIATTAGTQLYALPENFQSLRRLDRVSGGERLMVEPAPLLELDLTSAGSSTDVRYR